MTRPGGLKGLVLGTGLARIALLPRRLRSALGCHLPRIADSLRWVLRSREFTNYSYEYSPRNREFLAQTLAVVTSRRAVDVRCYLVEAQENRALRDQLAECRRTSHYMHVTDDTLRLGRQLAWYALVRLLRPRNVVETGVGYGLSAALVSEALLQNADEGAPGWYVGVDLDPAAGFLLGSRHASVARLVQGDSLAMLRQLPDKVDLFISDSHVSAQFEYDECQAVVSRLAPGAVVATTVSELLPRFAEETGRRCVVFREEPVDHWFPGAWIGFAFAATPAG